MGIIFATIGKEMKGVGKGEMVEEVELLLRCYERIASVLWPIIQKRVSWIYVDGVRKKTLKCMFATSMFLLGLFRRFFCWERVELVFKTTTTQELAKEWGWRYLIVVNRYEIFEEFEHAVCFGILFTKLWYVGKDRFSMFAEHSQFK